MRLDKSLAKTISKRLGKSFASLKRLRVIEQLINGTRTTASGASIDKGIAVLKGLRGKAVKVSQIITNPVFNDSAEGWYISGISSYRVVGTTIYVTPSADWLGIGESVGHTCIIGHKYIIGCVVCNGDGDLRIYQDDSEGYISGSVPHQSGFSTYASVITATKTNGKITLWGSAGVEFGVKQAFCIDLTALGWDDISTYDDFLARWKAYYGSEELPNYYTEGEILVSKPSRLISKGRNLWDEEWELGGIDYAHGTNDDSQTGMIRSKNYTQIEDAGYYYKFNTTDPVRMFLYNGNKELVKYTYVYVNDVINFVAQYGCKYVRFALPQTTYNHDICINVSDSRNGEYAPYMEDSLAITLPSLFADGILSVGDVADEWGTKATKRVGVVDLGSLNWQYSHYITDVWSVVGAIETTNIVSAKYNKVNWQQTPPINSIMAVEDGGNVVIAVYNGSSTEKPSGILLYELATPIEEQTPFPIGFYKAEPNGTEEVQGISRNLWDEKTEKGYIYQDDNINPLVNSWHSDFIPIPPSASSLYVLTYTYLDAIFYDVSKQRISLSSVMTSSAVNVPSGTAYIRIQTWEGMGADYQGGISISEGSTPIPYEPHIIPTLLDGFIGYEGMDTIANLASAWGIDADKVGIDVCDGTELWVAVQMNNIQAFAHPVSNYAISKGNMSCSPYKRCTDSSAFGDKMYWTSQWWVEGIHIADLDYADVDDWKAHLADLYASGCPLTIYYEKA